MSWGNEREVDSCGQRRTSQRHTRSYGVETGTFQRQAQNFADLWIVIDDKNGLIAHNKSYG